jgi:hypothetical protein
MCGTDINNIDHWHALCYIVRSGLIQFHSRGHLGLSRGVWCIAKN